MKREQFTFYRSYWEAFKGLPKKDRDPVIMAICAYALDEETIPLTGTAAVVFALIKPTLDASRIKAKNRIKTGTNEERNENKTGTNEEQNEK